MSDNNTYRESVKFIQFIPWVDCINHCSFCFNKNNSNTTSIFNKKIRLNKILSMMKEFDTPTRFGLFGGEFFEGQLIGVEDEWFKIIDEINNNPNIESFQVYATLINTQYLLDETISRLKKPFLICTSYDEVGRFHTEDKKLNWFKNIYDLHEKKISLFCTTIPTKEFITSNSINLLPEWLGFNFNGPSISCEWFKGLVEQGRQLEYNELINKSHKFNLPTRDEFITWCIKHKDRLSCFLDFHATHSDTIYEFNEDDNSLVVQTSNKFRFTVGINIRDCGHPYTDAFYSDSDQCAACDAQMIVDGV